MVNSRSHKRWIIRALDALSVRGVGTLTVDDEAVSAAASYLGLA
jgi:hypothetical protein